MNPINLGLVDAMVQDGVGHRLSHHLRAPQLQQSTNAAIQNAAIVASPHGDAAGGLMAAQPLSLITLLPPGSAFETHTKTALRHEVAGSHQTVEAVHQN